MRAVALHRSVYRYSVVAGGTHTPEEAQAAVARDRVVAEHYRPVETARLQLVRTRASALKYVSYRRNNRVFWTRERHRVPADEAVLAHGSNQIRARCGNRLSDWPQQPVADDDEEPSDDELGTIANEVPVSAAALVTRTAVGNPGFVPASDLPFIPLPGDGRPAAHPQPAQPDAPGAARSGSLGIAPQLLGGGLSQWPDRSGEQTHAGDLQREPIAAELTQARPETPSGQSFFTPVSFELPTGTSRFTPGEIIRTALDVEVRRPTPSSDRQQDSSTPGETSSDGGTPRRTPDLPGSGSGQLRFSSTPNVEPDFSDDRPFQPQLVPEPGTALLSAGALLALVALRRRLYR
ncbi:MAG TPA: hypothetical protein VES20_17920 [Bryobacteraceae bacterium]|nr:hypothetical protein [Bryobacteraceae bacterium]